MKATSITRRDFGRRALALGAAPCLAPFAAGLASTTHAQSKQPGTVKTALSWIPNHQFAGMWIAMDKGWFDADGVKVEWRPGGPNTPNPVERVSSGEVQLGQQANPRPVLEAIVRGNDFVSSAAASSASPAACFRWRRSPVLEPKDMVGKRIIGPTPTDARTIETALKANKLPRRLHVRAGRHRSAGAARRAGRRDGCVRNQPDRSRSRRRGWSRTRTSSIAPGTSSACPATATSCSCRASWLDENRDSLVALPARPRSADGRRTSAIRRSARASPPRSTASTSRSTSSASCARTSCRSRSCTARTPKRNGLFWVNRDRLGGPVYDALRAGGVERLPDVDKILDMSLLKSAKA